MAGKIHIIGIGGSAMSALAVLAKSRGYTVTGCDLDTATPYIEKVKKAGIEIFKGHDESHIQDQDLVVTTPASFFQNDSHPEILKSKKKKILLTGREFEGKFLQADKTVICIAGTHGKSTTTALTSLVFENAGFDPTVLIGATVPSWDANFRVGKSKFYICESDEFYDSFLSYKPEVIILNNIEFDHPDYFATEEQMYESFANHVKNLIGAKILIYNDDDQGIKKLFQLLGQDVLKNLRLYGYTLDGKNIALKEDETSFDVDGENFKLKIPGIHNVSNALGVITLARLFNISVSKIKESLFAFEGIGRRLELIGEKRGVVVLDDYAHHPTAIKVTLNALRQKYPKNKILAIIEPHSYSRTRSLLKNYKGTFDTADEVIIAPIFKARDKEDFGVSGQSIVDVSDHKNIKYLDSFDKITEIVSKNAQKSDIIIIMGAGKSYELAKKILESLDNYQEIPLEVEKNAKKIWDYMHLNQSLKKADCILAMGGNYMKVAEKAIELYNQGYAPLLVFSGSKGKYSQHFEKSEAEMFAQIAINSGVPKENILLETKSTNTAENILFTKELLEKEKIALQTIILIQKPYTERRAYATFMRIWPHVDAVVTSPQVSFEEMMSTFSTKRQFICTLVAQLERLHYYGQKGFLVKQKIPPTVQMAFDELVKLGYTDLLGDIKLNK